MKNYVQRGDTLTVPAPVVAASGDGVLVGGFFGVSNGSAAIGQPMDLDVVGVFILPKVAALAIALGDIVYWDNAARLVTKTAGGNTKIGAAVEAVANPSATVNVRLNGVA